MMPINDRHGDHWAPKYPFVLPILNEKGAEDFTFNMGVAEWGLFETLLARRNSSQILAWYEKGAERT